MKKVVIDTNIVISAAISPYGNPAKILDMVLDREIQMYYCDGIMNEYINVLSRPRLNALNAADGVIILDEQNNDNPISLAERMLQ